VEVEDVAEEVLASEIQERAGPTEKTPPAVEFEHGSRTKPLGVSEAASEADPTLLTPSVRQLIKKLNLNASEIHGTGRNGRILKEDVHRHNAQKTSPQASVSIQTSRVSSTLSQDRVILLTPTQNAMFKTMTRSLTIPHFLYTHSVDFTALNSQRKRLNANVGMKDPYSPKLTGLPFIMKALSQAFNEFPLLNSHLDTKNDSSKPQILLKGSHNFGIAVDAPNGLVVPVVKNVQHHSISSLAVEIERLSGLAKAGKLTVDDMQGATFTISNIGSIGGGVVSPVIVVPMVGMLAVGRMSPNSAVAKDAAGLETIVKREEVVLSWSADHRILDGATVARCADLVKRLLEDEDTIEISR
jgi:2-oxoisovalerate dehydrogenase E2 component (dihydrolipoyl transacylase)